MKTSHIKIVSAIVAVCAVASASAQAVDTARLVVATGPASGTYSRMYREFANVCKDQITMVEAQPQTSGSVQNMDKLIGNEVNAAIVQTDVLFYKQNVEDLSWAKTLFSLHPEEVHIVAKTTSNVKEGGFAGIGAKTVVFNTINDLAGRNVAAWGGSTVTAQVVRLQSQVAFNVVEVSDFKAAKQRLDSGAVSAIVMVGGSPMADVVALNQDYKLLSVPDATAAKLKQVYVPAMVNYSNLGAGGAGIKTVATEALFVTRAYTSPKFVASLSALRACFKNNVDDLAQTTGTHRKWQVVARNAGNTGKWAYYELPARK